MQDPTERRDQGVEAAIEVKLRGRALLRDPLLNKGSAFSQEERDALSLRGLLPPSPGSIELQLRRVYAQFVDETDPLARYVALADLQDRNEVLFYRLLLDHLEEMAPIVYTPTVGQACQRYSHIFRRGRGVWITPADRGRIKEALLNGCFGDTRLIVATDNERILGLGDQGAGGMGIPIGKLVLYTVGAGIHPSQVLPVSLDVGTDNQELLADPLYLGCRQPRLRGPEYDELVEEFVVAVQQAFPRALLQWEDFKKAIAFKLLDRYRERLLSFNDDIQGTAAVALAGVMAACRVTGLSMAEQRVVILGAGAAGIGIGRQLRDALARAGVRGDDLVRAIAVLDSRGLLVRERPSRDEYKQELAWPAALVESVGLDPNHDNQLQAVVEKLRPTVLIGTSGQPGVFEEPMVRAMAATTSRPVILPFSNPTANCEALPEDLIRWTDGRALVASGSPFEPVEHGGRSIRIGQGNNVFIFPGVGLGALVARARKVTDTMFTVAAETLAGMVLAEDLAEGSLYPELSRLREISKRIAVAVALEAADEQVAEPLDEATAAARVEAAAWEPRYPKLVAV